MINKEDSSPGLRCVHCPKIEIFVKIIEPSMEQPA